MSAVLMNERTISRRPGAVFSIEFQRTPNRYY